MTERFKWARQRLEGMLNDIDSENKREWSSRQEIHQLILENIERDTNPELKIDGTPFYLFHLVPEITSARVAAPCFPFKVNQIKAALYSLPDIWDENGDDRESDFLTVDTAITMIRVQVGRLTLLTLTDPGAEEMEEKAMALDGNWGAKAIGEDPYLLEDYECSGSRDRAVLVSFRSPLDHLSVSLPSFATMSL